MRHLFFYSSPHFLLLLLLLLLLFNSRYPIWNFSLFSRTNAGANNSLPRTNLHFSLLQKHRRVATRHLPAHLSLVSWRWNYSSL